MHLQLRDCDFEINVVVFSFNTGKYNFEDHMMRRSTIPVCLDYKLLMRV